MSQAPTAALLERAKAGEEAAREQALRENSGLIWSIVRRYFGRGAEAEDLYQLGCIGFLKALEGFDSDYGTRFSTYAVPKIAGEIRRFLRDDGAIKVSRTLKERSAALRAAAAALGATLGREPTIGELAGHLGLTAEEVAAAQTAAEAVVSLQAETHEGLTLESTLGTEAPEEAVVERLALQSAVAALPEREKKVILLRYYRSLTQEQTARILAVSQVQVSRIEKKALLHLRQTLT